MEEWGIYISMYTNNMTDCNTYSKGSMVQKLDKQSSILHHLHINHKISVHDRTNIMQYVNSAVCRNSEKIVGFFEGDEDEIDDTEYKSDGNDEIDSTEDEGNDDDTTGTGGKIIYIYIYKCCNNKWVCTENQQAL